MPAPRPRTRRASTAAIAACSLLAAAGCRSDGREMRPADPDQTASVSTTSPPTEVPAAVDDPLAGGLDFATTTTLPLVTTLPSAPTTAPGVPVTALPRIEAPWVDGGSIDVRYTCDGENVSPAINWTSAPEGTVEIALSLTDKDAPDFVHWAVAAIDPLDTAVGEDSVSPLALVALNSGGSEGWFGPCPPEGETHTYVLTVYFIGQQIEVGDGAPGAEMLAAIRANAFDSASITGTYERS